MMSKLTENAAGRLVPAEINGQEAVPYQGVGKYRPTGRKACPRISTCNDFPLDGNKVTESLVQALRNAGLRDGMTISTHHHLRNGDYVANAVFDAAAELGVKDLRWFPSASFPVHEPQIAHMESGVIHHIEGSMNGPLGDYCSRGKMRGMAVLRSHGGRYQAVQDGEVHIDIAVIAAPTADEFGNATGDRGPSACGLLGFALADPDQTVEVRSFPSMERSDFEKAATWHLRKNRRTFLDNPCFGAWLQKGPVVCMKIFWPAAANRGAILRRTPRNCR